MDTNDTRSRRGRAAGLVAAGLVGGVVLAGFASANAQSGQTPTPSPSGGTAQRAPLAKGGRPGGPGGHHGRGGMGMGIHGEFVVPNPDGGYRTIATQKGEVTAVSATSLTVKSADGYSRTYAVDDGTLVNAGNDGIADVKTGDDVHVMAVVTDGKAAAVDVRDVTNIEASRERWAPRPPAPDDAPPASAEGASA
ncbi:MAG TPA: hypothetical protein VF519_00230 [Mycobacteriales bacterium]|jgi:hypothetical protein